MEFDAQSAAGSYATKSTDELISIAYLDYTFVAQAKELAIRELARRGISSVAQSDLERVQRQLQNEEREKLERDTAHIESEEEMPGWRKAIRRALAPHRPILHVVTVGGGAILYLNSSLEWNLLNLNPRLSRALAMLLVLLWFVFLMPSREETIDHVQSGNKPKNPSG